MKPFLTPEPAKTNYDTPFTRNLLRILTGTAKAKPDETEAEYKDRYTAVVTAWAAFGPRDPVEQMLAAQIVGAHHAALDCLTQAMEAEDPATATRLQRCFTTMNRAMRDTMRVLAKVQERPAAALPLPPDIEPEAQPRKLVTVKPPQKPMHREIHRSPTTGRVFDFTRDPAKMDDEELAAAIVWAKARDEAAKLDGTAHAT